MDELPNLPPLPAIGQWIRVDVGPGMAIAAGRSAADTSEILGFTFVDPFGGLTVRGDFEEVAFGGEPAFIATPRLSLQLGGANRGLVWSPLGEAEVAARRLPVPPAWYLACGAQSPPGSRFGAWRDHPRLQGRFHPLHTDDLPVRVHDGGPRTTATAPEALWVRAYGCDGDLVSGIVLNKPFHLTRVQAGSAIRFLVTATGVPLYVTDKYLAERPAWTITPCSSCGLSELWDPPSELLRLVFPDQPAASLPLAFTAFCRCGGAFVVSRVGGAGGGGSATG